MAANKGPGKSERDVKKNSKKSSANQSLASMVAGNLDRYKDKNQKFRSLIDLLSDPYFLVACYQEIKGKPGNMTRGTTKETLDGIDLP
jgi:hypothetical protein